jgi:uncharacterized protein (TIGR02145 family)
MTPRLPLLCAVLLLAFASQAQDCVPGTLPTGLKATPLPGQGTLLQWTPVPGSAEVQIKVQSPQGTSVSQRLAGRELQQYLLPETELTAGDYTWQIQVSCQTLSAAWETSPVASSAFSVARSGSCPATLTDVDGNVYSTVQIGTQCWMAENLKTEHYRDGSPIPTGLSDGAWSAATTPAFAAYENSAANKAVYGLIYNWYAANAPAGLCPAGWHVPSDDEWTQLTDFLGGTTTAAGQMKTTGTLTAGTGLWARPNNGASNSSGFSGLPAGYRGKLGAFTNLSFVSGWWSSTGTPESKARSRAVTYKRTNTLRPNFGRAYGFSVRCLQD